MQGTESLQFHPKGGNHRDQAKSPSDPRSTRIRKLQELSLLAPGPRSLMIRGLSQKYTKYKIPNPDVFLPLGGLAVPFIYYIYIYVYVYILHFHGSI